MSDLKVRTPLEEAQARLAAATAKRVAQVEAGQVERILREAADEEKIAELEASYPDGFASVRLNSPITGYPGFVAARDCSGAEYKRYQASVKTRVVGKAVEVDSSSEHSAQLARACLIYPESDDFAKMCELRPGLASGLGSDIVNRAQTRKNEAAKKLTSE